jgi:thiol-disulfide isomerase/thioredoxin
VARTYVICLILAVVAGVSACRRAAPPVAIDNKPASVNGVPLDGAPGQPRKPVPEMSWTGFDGTVFKLKDFQGKVVILDFWATYCPPCIEEIPHLKELQAKYGEQRIAVIGLHVGDDEDRPKIPEFAQRLKITYPLAYPEDDLTAFVFGRQTAIPQTAIFDGSGKFVKKITGFDPQIKAELDKAVEAALRQNG